MCSCKNKTLNGGTYTLNSILNDKNLTEALIDGTVVSKECFRSGHPLSVFRYLYCAAGSRFTDLFKKYNIEINSDQDIRNLAIISEKGLDKQNFNGANFLEMAKSLTLTESEIGKTECIIFC